MDDQISVDVKDNVWAFAQGYCMHMRKVHSRTVQNLYVDSGRYDVAEALLAGFAFRGLMEWDAIRQSHPKSLW